MRNNTPEQGVRHRTLAAVPFPALLLMSSLPPLRPIGDLAIVSPRPHDVSGLEDQESTPAEQDE
ncbi:MAG: hypothetical protein QF511_07880 [Rhodospirillales bacterium]|nr:hypothetical protein [Rhodospirillales bacterium]HJP54558.1 hypothetical protein [Rhodospirillales bacterium]